MNLLTKSYDIFENSQHLLVYCLLSFIFIFDVFCCDQEKPILPYLLYMTVSHNSPSFITSSNPAIKI